MSCITDQLSFYFNHNQGGTFWFAVLAEFTGVGNTNAVCIRKKNEFTIMD